jgi:hypothetical protein
MVSALTDEDYARLETEDIDDVSVESGGWILLDAYTASALKQCYEVLTRESNPNAEANREKFNRLPLDVLVGFCFKHAK